jgi:hypothetical protein
MESKRWAPARLGPGENAGGVLPPQMHAKHLTSANRLKIESFTFEVEDSDFKLLH